MERLALNAWGADLGHYPGWRLLHMGERGMPLRDIELDSGRTLDRGVSNFAYVVLKALGHDNLDAVLRTVHRILNRLDIGFEHAWDR